jgi:hypothetical protein
MSRANTPCPKTLGAKNHMNLNMTTADERRLIKCLRALGPAERETLFAFADFLVARAEQSPNEPSVAREPRALTRPKQESVVGAIKRLSQSYDMLERNALLHETSALMSAHVLQGRPANDVIDELETLFARHYRDYRARILTQD